MSRPLSVSLHEESTNFEVRTEDGWSKSHFTVFSADIGPAGLKCYRTDCGARPLLNSYDQNSKTKFSKIRISKKKVSSFDSLSPGGTASTLDAFDGGRHTVNHTVFIKSTLCSNGPESQDLVSSRKTIFRSSTHSALLRQLASTWIDVEETVSLCHGAKALPYIFASTKGNRQNFSRPFSGRSRLLKAFGIT